MVKTAEGAVTNPLNFDFSVAAGGGTLGPIDGKKFLVFGRPRAEFPAEAVAADTAEGQAAIAAWEKSVADYNQALKTHESRTRTDRNKEMVHTGVGQATKIFEIVCRVRQPAPGNTGTGVTPVKPATLENTPAVDKGDTKDQVGEVLKKVGSRLGSAGVR